MQKIVFLVIAIGIIIVLIYAVILPVFRDLNLGKFFSGLSLHSTSSLTVGSRLPPPPSPQPAPTPAAPPSPPTPTPPPGFTVAQLSPLYQKVHLSSVQPPSFGWNGQFNLSSVDSSLTSGVDVTGWRVHANHGDVVIPQAVANYNPAGTAASADIVLQSSDYLEVYGSQNPIGVNLRLNECMGYLNGTANFTPALPDNCPAIDQGVIGGFSGRCQSYIDSLGGCRIPTVDEMNSFSDFPDADCQAYIQRTFNYLGCYNHYVGTANFFSNEWRVWTGTVMPFDQQHDQILLLDAKGLLVDRYTY